MAERIAIVTGANKGLGFAIVKSLCEKFKGIVYLTSRDEKRGNEACKELEKLGLKPKYHQLDVCDDKSVSRFYTHILTTHERIDLLINNAGVLFLKDAKEPKIYQSEQTLRANFFGLVNFTETILPLIADQGVIINISSSSGHLSRIPSEELRKKINDPDLNLDELKIFMKSYLNSVKSNRDLAAGWGDSPYVISKVGVNAYTFMLHRRLARRKTGISVNCLHPGYVMTDMTKGAGTVFPDQAADFVLKWALKPEGSGVYVWHDDTIVPWDGPDPRKWIDGL